VSLAEQFVVSIDDIFWDTITKTRIFRDPLDFKDLNKRSITNKIATQLRANTYIPDIPIQYYDAKGNGVLRGKKLFNIDDICVYYFCVVSIQNPLIDKIKSNPNVFGGFRINSALRVPKDAIVLENSVDEDLPIDPYGVPEISKISYKKEWSDYQNLSRNLYNKSFDLYIHLDIAHFYDDIDLSILENQLRIHSDRDKSDIINILMHLLESSSRSDYGFVRSHRGLPQEDLGEMSRVLANFYLSDFDGEFLEILDKIVGKDNFEYLRYADDMWIAIKGDKKLAFRIIQNASLILHKLRLHLNEGKTKILSRDEFHDYWCFDDWDKLFTIKNDIREVLRFMQKMEKKQNAGVRWFTPYLYALRIVTNNLGNVSAFKSRGAREKFILSILQKEKLLSTKADGVTQFVAKMIESDDSLRSLLTNEVNNTIIPSVEYFSLNVLSEVDSKNHNLSKKKMMWYYSTYKRLNNSNWQWYSKCIVLNLMSSKVYNYNTIPEYHDILAKMMEFFADKIHTCNYIEKRYQIKFMYEYSKDLDEDQINKLHNDYISRSLWQHLTSKRVKAKI
jgi:ribosome biogenesis protein Nip4